MHFYLCLAYLLLYKIFPVIVNFQTLSLSSLAQNHSRVHSHRSKQKSVPILATWKQIYVRSSAITTGNLFYCGSKTMKEYPRTEQVCNARRILMGRFQYGSLGGAYKIRELSLKLSHSNWLDSRDAKVGLLKTSESFLGLDPYLEEFVSALAGFGFISLFCAPLEIQSNEPRFHKSTLT